MAKADFSKGWNYDVPQSLSKLDPPFQVEAMDGQEA